MQHKPATTREKIHDIIEQRWSPRAIDPDKAVSNQQLYSILEAARWAPSCFNDQPWRYIVCVKHNNEISWQNILNCLVEKNRQWAKNAPVLIIAVAMNNFRHNGKPNRWAIYDTGAASTSLCLQATALGLATHQMGGFDEQKIRKVFELPSDCTAMSVIAVGYQADIDSLDDDFKDAEQAERSRLPLKQGFFSGRWDSSFD